MAMKKYHLHLDAIIVIALLFIISLGINFAQYTIYKDLMQENQSLQMKTLVDSFNLEEMEKTIERLNKEKEARSEP